MPTPRFPRTDLGTGWLTAEGTIPALPLELYDLVLDLGSFRSRAYPPADLRSTRNENSGLPGARRYMGQAAAYRLSYRKKPALLDGFTTQEGELLTIRMQPQDLRKPCLEHLMRCAEEGDAEAAAVFRVKRPGVFALLDEGFRRGIDGVRLIPSDENLANTPLMRSLAQSPDATVAQFGQAIGAIYFALT